MSAIRTGRARLSFTLTAGENGGNIKTLTIRLPRGLAFSHSNKKLEAGIVVKTGGKRLKLTARISHGKLTLRLKRPMASVYVRIASPAIHRHSVKTPGIKPRYAVITTTTTNHKFTRLILKRRAR